MPTERSRYFVFTNWNVDFDYNRAMGRLQYVRYGEETCPDTGRPHHQGWCYTKEKYSIRQVALALRDLNDERIAWVKIMRASEAANDNYTGKDGIVHYQYRLYNTSVIRPHEWVVYVRPRTLTCSARQRLLEIRLREFVSHAQTELSLPLQVEA